MSDATERIDLVRGSDLDDEVFATPIDYPCAVSDQSDEGQEAALRWVLNHLADDQMLTDGWSRRASSPPTASFVRNLASYRNVEVAVGRGSGHFTPRGPVLALHADADDLREVTSACGITALCVVRWSDRLPTWIAETGATVLHELDLDDADREFLRVADAVELAPAFVEALKSVSSAIIHNNTISAGYEKGIVVRALLRLHDDGVELPSQEMKKWAAAHGWRGDNPTRLAEFAERINKGGRPRIR